MSVVSTTPEFDAVTTGENEATRTDWLVISVEDWALIRRLVAEGLLTEREAGL